jgi:hypothetical protein
MPVPFDTDAVAVASAFPKVATANAYAEAESSLIALLDPPILQLPLKELQG